MEEEKTTICTKNYEAEAFLSEYDDILTGRKKKFSVQLLSNAKSSEICAKTLKLIFERYLKWTPTEVRDKLTKEVIEYNHLGPLIDKIPCPTELDKNTDLFYVAWYLYPSLEHQSGSVELLSNTIIRTYKNVLDGKTKKFPKDYFQGRLARRKARYMFRIMLNEYLIPNGKINSIDDAYRVFASREGKSILSQYKLNTPLKQIYDSVAINFLHDSLLEQADNNLYYKYFATSEIGEDMSKCMLDEAELEEAIKVTQKDIATEKALQIKSELNEEMKKSGGNIPDGDLIYIYEESENNG